MHMPENAPSRSSSRPAATRRPAVERRLAASRRFAVTRRLATTLALCGLLLCCAGALAAAHAASPHRIHAHAARAGFLTGIGDEQAEMFTDPNWLRLHTKITRYIAPYDAAVR
jgi:hypothetical protein